MDMLFWHLVVRKEGFLGLPPNYENKHQSRDDQGGGCQKSQTARARPGPKRPHDTPRQRVWGDCALPKKKPPTGTRRWGLNQGGQNVS